MITVSELSKSYGKYNLLDRVTFQVGSGERVGLVGRNGHGKSTLFKMILGQEHIDEGEITVPSGYRIGHLAQHIRFTKPTVLEETVLAMPHNEDGVDESYRAKAMLTGLGFSMDDMERAPSEFSGGYQVRLNLAKALLAGPNMILLDEPTNYLDITSIRWLKNFLRNWQGEMMIITHDRDFMDSITTHTIGIHRNKIRKVQGSTEKLYAQILLEEEVHEKTRINDDKKRKETELFIARFRSKATKAKAVQSRIKALERHERLDQLDEIKNLDFAFNPAPFPGKLLIESEEMGFGYDAKNVLFSNLTFTVGKRDRIAVIGPNGKGKSTLLRLLAGELTPTKGKIRLNTNLKTGYFGQTNIDRLTPTLTVEQEIQQANPALMRTNARAICGAMMFEGDLAEKKISVLSGGERSRVMLGTILAKPVNCLLLDEPTNHLDMDSVDALIEALNAFDGAVIIVTHLERLLEAVATRLIVFDGGKAELFEGNYFDFLERVGWRSEAVEARKGAVKQVNKKELRRQRAEIVARKSKELGVIKKRVESAESEITTIEKRIAQEESELVDASARGDGESIKTLSASLKSLRDKTDALFDQLEKLAAEHEDKSKTFDAELSGTEE